MPLHINPKLTVPNVCSNLTTGLLVNILQTYFRTICSPFRRYPTLYSLFTKVVALSEHSWHIDSYEKRNPDDVTYYVLWTLLQAYWSPKNTDCPKLLDKNSTSPNHRRIYSLHSNSIKILLGSHRLGLLWNLTTVCSCSCRCTGLNSS